MPTPELTAGQVRALRYAEGPARRWQGGTALGLWECLDKRLLVPTESSEYPNGVVITPAGHSALSQWEASEKEETR